MCCGNVRGMKPIMDIARTFGLDPAHLEPYGYHKGKVALAALDGRPLRGKLVLVSAITPTPAGEGKTTCSVGIAQGLARIGKRSAVALREPSLGPYLGLKGGGTGGGMSQVVPSDDINLHFTGDIHAVSSAHNLLAALVDNHLHHGNALGIDSRRVLWRRVMDMNDRALRDIVIGLGGHREGVPRETGFDISAASEVMAILCLAQGVADLKERLSRIVVGYRPDGSPVRAADLKAVGAMAALLRDAVKPNLVQTVEGVPAVLHGGPFANIAHGTNSITATRLALAYSDIVVTEAGFAFELGAAAVVLGLVNMEKHLENIKKFEQPCVVAINNFPTDTADEVAVVQQRCAELGIQAVVARPFSAGGDGCTEIAEVVWEMTQKSKPHFRPLYEWTDSIATKIEKVAHEMYGAEAVDYTVRAKRDRTQFEKLGYGGLPICIAKTQQSLSDNPALLGRPKDFLVTVREIQRAAGAGYLGPITGEILRMPGLPREPLAERFDLTEAGEIVVG